MKYEYDLPLNAEPWAIGPVGSGRRKDSGKLYSYVGRNQQLHAFQEAVKDLVGVQEFIPGEIELQLFIWRQIAEYKSDLDRKTFKHHADSTNLQKGIEDALQGCLFENDRQVTKNVTEVMEQSTFAEPRIYIRCFSRE